jgi:hypothetical protein
MCLVPLTASLNKPQLTEPETPDALLGLGVGVDAVRRHLLSPRAPLSQEVISCPFRRSSSTTINVGTNKRGLQYSLRFIGVGRTSELFY